MDQQTIQTIDLTTRALYSLGEHPRVPGLNKMDLIRTLILSIYNRGLAYGLVAAANDELSTEEMLHRAALLGEISLQETNLVATKIAEVLR